MGNGVSYGSSGKTTTSVADTWTALGVPSLLPLRWSGKKKIDFQGVYWNGSDTKYLKLRDAGGNEIYSAVSDGTTAVVDLLASPITVRLPISYLTDEASKTITVYGRCY